MRLARFAALSSVVSAAVILSMSKPAMSSGGIPPMPNGDYYLTMTVAHVGEQAVTPMQSIVLSLTAAHQGSDLVLSERDVTGGPTFVGHTQADGTFVLETKFGEAAVSLRGVRSTETPPSIRGALTVKDTKGLESGSFWLASSPPVPQANMAPSSGNQTGKKGAGGGGRTIATYSGPCTGCSSSGSPSSGDGSTGSTGTTGSGSSSSSGGFLSGVSNWFGSLFNWGGTPAPATTGKKH